MSETIYFDAFSWQHCPCAPKFQNGEFTLFRWFFAQLNEDGANQGKTPSRSSKTRTQKLNTHSFFHVREPNLESRQ